MSRHVGVLSLMPSSPPQRWNAHVSRTTMRENAGNSRYCEETRQAFQNSGEGAPVILQPLVAILTFQKCPFFLVWTPRTFAQGIFCTTFVWESSEGRNFEAGNRRCGVVTRISPSFLRWYDGITNNSSMAALFQETTVYLMNNNWRENDKKMWTGNCASYFMEIWKNI